MSVDSARAPEDLPLTEKMSQSIVRTISLSDSASYSSFAYYNGTVGNTSPGFSKHFKSVTMVTCLPKFLCRNTVIS